MLQRFLDMMTFNNLMPAAVLFVLLFLLVVVMVKAQRRPDFDVANFLRDDSGKESAARAFAFVALAITSWGFVTLVLSNQMTPDYFLWYNITWANTIVLIKGVEKWNGSLPLAGRSQQPTA